MLPLRGKEGRAICTATRQRRPGYMHRDATRQRRPGYMHRAATRQKGRAKLMLLPGGKKGRASSLLRLAEHLLRAQPVVQDALLGGLLFEGFEAFEFGQCRLRSLRLLEARVGEEELIKRLG